MAGMIIWVVYNAHLRRPPPLSGIHIKVDPHSVLRVSIMTLGHQEKDRCELWVAKQCLDALKYVTIEYFECLSCDDNLMALEWWTSGRELGVDC